MVLMVRAGKGEETGYAIVLPHYFDTKICGLSVFIHLFNPMP